MSSNPATRSDIALMIPDGGTVIELGVAAGKFAVQMLEANPAIQYIGIDRWSDHHDEVEMRNAQEKLRRFDGSILIRDTFEAQVEFWQDESADMIYVDGYAHTGQEGGKTLDDWYPKVKRGGIFAGHDYDPNWPATIEAVDAFIAKHPELTLNIIRESPYSSWWVRKA